MKKISLRNIFYSLPAFSFAIPTFPVMIMLPAFFAEVHDFDIAIIGAGSYSLPLAVHCKQKKNASAIIDDAFLVLNSLLSCSYHLQYCDSCNLMNGSPTRSRGSSYLSRSCECWSTGNAAAGCARGQSACFGRINHDC